MALTVSLRAVVQEMDVPNDEWESYINRITGELFTITENIANAIEYEDSYLPDWEEEYLLKARKVAQDKDYIRLPGRCDIHEYEIMKRFCHTVGDETMQLELLKAINGSGAFRRFKNMIYRFNIRDEWYEFRDAALQKIAAEFLESQGIAYAVEK